MNQDNPIPDKLLQQLLAESPMKAPENLSGNVMRIIKKREYEKKLIRETREKKKKLALQSICIFVVMIAISLTSFFIFSPLKIDIHIDGKMINILNFPVILFYLGLGYIFLREFADYLIPGKPLKRQN